MDRRPGAVILLAPSEHQAERGPAADRFGRAFGHVLAFRDAADDDELPVGQGRLRAGADLLGLESLHVRVRGAGAFPVHPRQRTAVIVEQGETAIHVDAGDGEADAPMLHEHDGTVAAHTQVQRPDVVGAFRRPVHHQRGVVAEHGRALVRVPHQHVQIADGRDALDVQAGHRHAAFPGHVAVGAALLGEHAEEIGPVGPVDEVGIVEPFG